jgi:hypothetical protein
VGQLERVAGRYDPDIKDIIESSVLLRPYEEPEKSVWIPAHHLETIIGQPDNN